MKLFRLAGALLVLLTGHAHAFSYENNTVQLKMSESGYTIKSASFTVSAFSITAGQDPNGNIAVGETFSLSNSQFEFTIGRKGSTSVTQFFDQVSPGADNTNNSTPSSLNFALQGTLTLRLTGGVLGTYSQTYTFPGIVLAQQGSTFSNPWWFGGTSCTYIGSNQVTCPGTSAAGTDVSFTFKRGGNGSNEVQITSTGLQDYQMVSVYPQYLGENTRCGWQLKHPEGQYYCPPYVVYNSPAMAQDLELYVYKGRLYKTYVNGKGTVENKPFSTTGRDDGAIYVMSATGQIFASVANRVLLYHHSSLLAGAPVAAAGHIHVHGGRINHIDNCSGHYRPPFAVANQVIESLSRQGYSAPVTMRDCKSKRLNDGFLPGEITE